MRSKADETFVIVETLICPLQIFQVYYIYYDCSSSCLKKPGIIGDKIVYSNFDGNVSAT